MLFCHAALTLLVSAFAEIFARTDLTADPKRKWFFEKCGLQGAKFRTCLILVADLQVDFGRVADIVLRSQGHIFQVACAGACQGLGQLLAAMPDCSFRRICHPIVYPGHIIQFRVSSRIDTGSQCHDKLLLQIFRCIYCNSQYRTSF